ncbi:hypothetical protein [Tatumella sp. UCD-D_suzukii]|uniref:hypothetical protein n=1 Tax=Tatumella sp. UCD-D_suzukii TaxID=1408192 RepID=UPI00046FF1D3|nr:hypothetical protein [Tatumella sp. UCD-D_suzukii]
MSCDLSHIEVEQFQEGVFLELAKKITLRLPENSLRLTPPNPLINEEFRALKQQGLLMWDASEKFFIRCDLAESHPIKLIVYYRKQPIGYAMGGYNTATNTVEISWLEKRRDAHRDLDRQFLPIVLESFTGYALALRLRGITPTSIALTNPLQNRISYYSKSGFSFKTDYHKGMPAMILPLAS